MLGLIMLSGSAMAQESQPNRQNSKAVSQREQSEVRFDSAEREQARSQVKAMRPKRVRMTQEQMTEKMVSDLKLDEKQVKKVTKLNKKFKTLIEGEQQENMKDQRPPMGQGRPDGNRGGGRPGSGFGGGMPGGGIGGPGGFGGAPGSRQKDIKYTGATTLTATATETGKNLREQ